MEPPTELDGAGVLHWAEITDEVLPTGRTTHVAGEIELGPAAASAIGRYPQSEGFYLLYLDAATDVMTDTFHDSIDGAFAQAAFEYVGLEWRAVASGS
jgi:hypothetical protein